MWAPPACASHSEELRRAQLVYTRIPSAIFAGGLRMTRQLDGARSSVFLHGRPLMDSAEQIIAVSVWARQVEIESNSFHTVIYYEYAFPAFFGGPYLRLALYRPGR